MEKHAKKPWKNKKKSDPWTLGLGRGLAGDMGLNFLFFLFLFFPWFLVVWPKPRENQKKQKKPKKSDPWATSGERPGRGHGSEFFVFCVFFVFSIVFWHVFHVKMLSSQHLSKNARFYNLHTCAPHEYPFCFF